MRLLSEGTIRALVFVLMLYFMLMGFFGHIWFLFLL